MAHRGAWAVAATAASTVLLSALVFGAPASAQGATGTVTVVHGLRGLLADVYLDGKIALDGFAPERATDPIQIPVGDHLVEVREADAPPDSEPAVSGELKVQAFDNLSAVAHLSEDGTPTLTVFRNDLAKLGPGTTRVVVRHTAEAPPVDVMVGGAALSTALDNPREAGQILPAATQQVLVNSAEDRSALVPPADVTFAAGTAQFLYLIGSAPDGSVTWLTQTLEGLQAPPTAINTGNSGLVDPDRTATSTSIAALLTVLLTAAALTAAVVVVDRRRTA